MKTKEVRYEMDEHTHSPFKFQTAPAQPPVMSAAAQSLTSPSAPFIFPGAAPVQPQVPITPV